MITFCHYYIISTVFGMKRIKTTIPINSQLPNILAVGRRIIFVRDIYIRVAWLPYLYRSLERVAFCILGSQAATSMASMKLCSKSFLLTKLWCWIHGPYSDALRRKFCFCEV